MTERQPHHGVVIVGTGHAGAQAAVALRQCGYTGSILMIGRETVLPYERPPLSKDYLSGGKPLDRLLLRKPEFWADKDVEFALGTSVVEIDPVGHAVTTDGGRRLFYSKLIWATGGSARRLACPGADLQGVHSVRELADVDALKRDLAAGAKQVVVIGGGYIGLEAAAVLTEAGCHLTVLEVQDRLLARVAGAELSAFYCAAHRDRGVDIRLRSSVESIEGREGRVTGVRLEDETVIPAQLVIVGIGIEPATAVICGAGASGTNGVDVDAFCRTGLPDVYAIGDCAAHESCWAGGARIRIESVQNANDMATAAARHICGNTAPYSATPWFWSNQYDRRLQTVGLSLGHDATVVRGDMGAGSFSVIYLKDGRVVALDCVNATRDFVQGRKLVEARAAVSSEVLADTNRPLKEMYDV